MAGVNKIDEYKRPSSTESINNQYGNPPKGVIINDTTANAVKKDYDQGNVELNQGQVKFLDSKVDEDTLDYNNDEMKNVGANQIETEGEDGESLKEKDQKAGSNASVAASASAAVTAAAAAITFGTTAKATDGFTGLIFAIATSSLAATCLALSIPSVYDPNIGERKNQTGAAPDTNNLIQQYYDTLSSDMDMLTEESAQYTELADTQTQADVDMITEIGALQAEMAVYQSQGNTQKVAELQKQIEDLKKGGEESSLKGEMDGIKESLETYSGNNAEASGVASSGATVSEFLEAGKPMANKAKAVQIMQGVAALACASAIVLPKIWTVVGPIDGVAATASTIMFAASALVFGSAATLMGKNAGAEGDAADAGEEMSGYVASLNDNVVSQSEFTETATAGYEEEDAAAAETTQKTQEGVDKANEKQAEQLAQTPQPQPETGAAPSPQDEKPEPVVAEDEGQGNTGGMAA